MVRSGSVVTLMASWALLFFSLVSLTASLASTKKRMYPVPDVTLAGSFRLALVYVLVWPTASLDVSVWLPIFTQPVVVEDFGQ